MYKLYRYLRSGEKELIDEFRFKKYALIEAKKEERYFINKSLGLIHDFDVVRVVVKKGRKKVYDKKEKNNE